MALGAQRQAIVAMVLKQAAIWVTAGLLIGVAAAFTLSCYIASLLFEVHPHEWGAYTASAGLLVLVSLAAAMIPALRASRVDPMVALRYE
jgi:ABC-type antimicrobial peptide transport system permease subunit